MFTSFKTLIESVFNQWTYSVVMIPAVVLPGLCSVGRLVWNLCWTELLFIICFPTQLLWQPLDLALIFSASVLQCQYIPVLQYSYSYPNWIKKNLIFPKNRNRSSSLHLVSLKLNFLYQLSVGFIIYNTVMSMDNNIKSEQQQCREMLTWCESFLFTIHFCDFFFLLAKIWDRGEFYCSFLLSRFSCYNVSDMSSRRQIWTTGRPVKHVDYVHAKPKGWVKSPAL